MLQTLHTPGKHSKCLHTQKSAPVILDSRHITADCLLDRGYKQDREVYSTETGRKHHRENNRNLHVHSNDLGVLSEACITVPDNCGLESAAVSVWVKIYECTTYTDGFLSSIYTRKTGFMFSCFSTNPKIRYDFFCFALAALIGPDFFQGHQTRGGKALSLIALATVVIFLSYPMLQKMKYVHQG